MCVCGGGGGEGTFACMEVLMWAFSNCHYHFIPLSFHIFLVFPYFNAIISASLIVVIETDHVCTHLERINNTSIDMSPLIRNLFFYHITHHNKINYSCMCGKLW